MNKLSFSTWVIVALALMVPISVLANEGVAELIDNHNYWAYPGGDYNNWRYSELRQINNRNASKLQVAWTFSTGRLQGHEGGPLVLPASATGLAGDTLFIHTSFPNDVFAINLDTKELEWAYEPQQNARIPSLMCCGSVNQGLAYADGKIFLQQADTVLVAIDVKTGKAVWKTTTGDPTKGQTNTNAPHPIKDLVFTGISAAGSGERSWIAAYRISDGSLAWKAYSVGPDADILFDANTSSMGMKLGKDSSLKTWKGDQWKLGGGSVSGWWSWNKKENLVYYGSGNPGTWNSTVRPGDNKWSMTIFARDVDTGIARWVYQMTPHDEGGYDGVNEMILADIKVQGKIQNVLVHFDRNGFAYTLNSATGALLVAEKYDPAVNWATHIDMKTGKPVRVAKYSTDANGEDVVTGNICPAALGTKNEQPAAYSPHTRLFYVPTNHVCMSYEPTSYAAGGNHYTAGAWSVHAKLRMFPAGYVRKDGTTNMGNFIAWNAAKGEIVWSIREQWSVWSGALATAGDVVFYGTLDSWVKAMDAQSGAQLWKFKAPSGIIGNFNTWSHRGKQYVGVLAGIGGWAGAVVANRALAKAPAGKALGAVGAYRTLNNTGRAGGTLMVFSLP